MSVNDTNWPFANILYKKKTQGPFQPFSENLAFFTFSTTFSASKYCSREKKVNKKTTPFSAVFEKISKTCPKFVRPLTVYVLSAPYLSYAADNSATVFGNTLPGRHPRPLAGSDSRPREAGGCTHGPRGP